MSDLPGPVAAILAVTPIHPVRGDVVTGWTHERAIPGAEVMTYRVRLGDPTPVAARQAAAVRPAFLRELADELEAREVPAEGKIWLVDARWLRNRADEIEETNR